MASIIFRTFFLYFFVNVLYRLMGKREVAQLGVVDLVISLLIAELGAISIEKFNDNIFNTIVPITILSFLEIFIAFLTMKCRKLGRFLEGKPTVIIQEGKIVYSNLEKERFSLDDLLMSLRQESITSIEDVRYAILEPNGKLSVFPYKLNKNELIPLPLIVEGKIQYNTLKMIGKNELWLYKVLRNNNLDINNIFYGIYKRKELYVINKNN